MGNELLIVKDLEQHFPKPGHKLEIKVGYRVTWESWG